MSTPLNSELLTVRQVAELLQVPVSWVYGRMRKGALERLPGYKLGKYWRFDREEVVAWVTRHQTNREAA
jgi:excisionase family DNA binding protein